MVRKVVTAVKEFCASKDEHGDPNIKLREELKDLVLPRSFQVTFCPERAPTRVRTRTHRQHPTLCVRARTSVAASLATYGMQRPHHREVQSDGQQDEPSLAHFPAVASRCRPVS